MAGATSLLRWAGPQGPLIGWASLPTLSDSVESAELSRMKRALAAHAGHPAVPRADGPFRIGDASVLLLGVDGSVTLETWLDDGPVPLDEVLDIFEKLADALLHVGRHGEPYLRLDPRTIAIGHAERSPWLLDFSGLRPALADAAVDASASTMARELRYAAPECTGRSNQAIDGRADIYALGILLYEAVGRMHPFAHTDALDLAFAHAAVRPRPLHAMRPDIPRALSLVVDKLIEKAPDARYQNLQAVRSDLQRVRTWLSHGGAPPSFRAGASDAPTVVLTPPVPIGREAEIAQLTGAFDRVKETGTVEAVFLSGEPGVGKTTMLTHPRFVDRATSCLFIETKAAKRDASVPFSTINRLVGAVAGAISAMGQPVAQQRREAIAKQLGGDAGLVLLAIPAVREFVGSDSTHLGYADANSAERIARFVYRLLTVLLELRKPLVIFMDDLQWCDVDSLRLISEWLTQYAAGGVLLLGAFRTAPQQEVETHDFVDSIRDSRIPVKDIEVAPLSATQMRRWTVAALGASIDHGADLADLIYRKTLGNPFFSGQFLAALVRDRTIQWSYDEARWVWDASRIAQQNYSDNVVELLLRSLATLPADTGRALCAAALLRGTRFSLVELAGALDCTTGEVRASLEHAEGYGLLTLAGDSGRFTHDRILEASLDAADSRFLLTMRRRVGRLLLARASPEEGAGDLIFDIAFHLNHSSELDSGRADARQRLGVNIDAARRAMLVGAFAAALEYSEHGRVALERCGARARYADRFAIDHLRARACFALGHMKEAEALAKLLATTARGLLDHTAADQLRLRIALARGRRDEVMDLIRSALERLDVPLPSEPTQRSVLAALQRFRRALGARSIADLQQLPKMIDRRMLKTVELLFEVASPLSLWKPLMWALVVTRGARLCLEHGNASEAPYFYLCIGALTGHHLGRYDVGFEFAQASLSLVAETPRCNARLETLAGLGGALIAFRHPHAESVAWSLQAYKESTEYGDPVSSAFFLVYVVQARLAASEPLEPLQTDLSGYVVSTKASRIGVVAQLLQGYLAYVQHLTGQGPQAQLADGPALDDGFERAVASTPVAYARVAGALVLLQHAVLAGDLAAARRHAARTSESLDALPAQLLVAWHHLWGAIAVAGAPGDPDSAVRLRAAVGYMQQRAQANPASFTAPLHIVSAELAKVEGRSRDAVRAYRAALDAAHAQGDLQLEALAATCAARAFDAVQADDLAAIYWNRARRAYSRWGAREMVRQIDLRLPQLRAHLAWLLAGEPNPSAPTVLDLAAVARAARAVAECTEELELHAVLVRVMLLQSGAERAVLLLSRPDTDAEWVRMTSARVMGSEVVVGPSGPVPQTLSATIPLALINTAAQKRQPIAVADALRSDALWMRDRYFIEHRTRSALAVPIARKDKVLAIAYFEHTGIAGIFDVTRVSTLSTIAAQGAISLQNALAYEALRAANQSLERRVAERTAELTQALAESTEANLAKRAFLANMSHDIRTPLSAMLGLMKLAGDAGLAPPARDCIHKANRAGEVLLALVNDILDFSKVEAGKIVLESLEFDLHELIEVVLDLGQVKAGEKGIGLVFECGSGVQDRYVGDPLRLQQILTNLVGNAIKFTAVGEVCVRVDVPASQDADAVLNFEVRDSGVGIPEEQLPNLFQPYTQAESSTARRFGGTGLGLSICRSLVDLMRGSIDVRSRLGIGTVISFSVRLQALPGSSPILGRADDAAAARIMLLEPHTTSGNAIQAMLEAMGHAVSRATSVDSLPTLVDDTAPARRLVFADAEAVDLQGPATACLTPVLSWPFVLVADPRATRADPRARRLPFTVVRELQRPVMPRALAAALASAWAGPQHDVDQDTRRGAAAVPPALAGLRVLYADDDELNRELGGHLLQHLGTVAAFAKDGVEAIAALRGGRFDAVLMDWEMPNMNGLEATSRIRGELGLVGLYIIGVSGNVLDEDRELALQCGMDDYLVKPFDPAQLARALKRAVRPGHGRRHPPR